MSRFKGRSCSNDRKKPMGVLLNYLKHAKLINGRKLLSQEVFAEAQVLLGSTRFSYQWHSPMALHPAQRLGTVRPLALQRCLPTAITHRYTR